MSPKGPPEIQAKARLTQLCVLCWLCPRMNHPTKQMPTSKDRMTDDLESLWEMLNPLDNDSDNKQSQDPPDLVDPANSSSDEESKKAPSLGEQCPSDSSLDSKDNSDEWMEAEVETSFMPSHSLEAKNVRKQTNSTTVQDIPLDLDEEVRDNFSLGSHVNVIPSDGFPDSEPKLEHTSIAKACQVDSAMFNKTQELWRQDVHPIPIETNNPTLVCPVAHVETTKQPWKVFKKRLKRPTLHVPQLCVDSHDRHPDQAKLQMLTNAFRI